MSAEIKYFVNPTSGRSVSGNNIQPEEGDIEVSEADYLEFKSQRQTAGRVQFQAVVDEAVAARQAKNAQKIALLIGLGLTPEQAALFT